MPTTKTVVCLRPEADFLRVGVTPPTEVSIRYMTPADPALGEALAAADALVIPAVGPKLSPALFEGSRLRLVQVTGAGIDRLDASAMRRLRIPVANVPGNAAVAEYCVASALVLLRRLAWSSAEVKDGRYAEFRARMMADNLAGLEDITVGVIGLGIIGQAVAKAFASHGSRIVYTDPNPPNPEAARAAGWTALAMPDLLAA